MKALSISLAAMIFAAPALAGAPSYLTVPGGPINGHHPTLYLNRHKSIIGSGQLPHLLDGYTHRPSWQVAGVDFAVGVPTGIILKDPSTISISGVSINTTSHVVTISGDNITLDGYDFTMNGGWPVNVTGANTTISNSAFIANTNGNTPIYANSGAGNLTVTHCVINGLNQDPGNLILFQAAATLTVTYSWLYNGSGDGIDMNMGPSSGSSSLIATNNLFQNMGMTSGAHGDLVQFLAGSTTQHISAYITYNTTSEVSGGSTQGFEVSPDVGAGTGNITGGEIGHNTFTGYISAFTGVTVTDLTGTFTIDNNYFDPTNTYGGLTFGGISGGVGDGNAYSVYTANINMVDGSSYHD